MAGAIINNDIIALTNRTSGYPSALIAGEKRLFNVLMHTTKHKTDNGKEMSNHFSPKTNETKTSETIANPKKIGSIMNETILIDLRK